MYNKNLDSLMVGIQELGDHMEPLLWLAGSTFFVMAVVFWWAVSRLAYMKDTDILERGEG